MPRPSCSAAQTVTGEGDVRARALVATLLSIIIMVSFQIYLAKVYHQESRAVSPAASSSSGSVTTTAGVSELGGIASGSDGDSGLELFYSSDMKRIDEFDDTIDLESTTLGFNESSPFVSAVVSNKFNFENGGYFMRSGYAGVGSILEVGSLGVLERDPVVVSSSASTVTYHSNVDGFLVEKRFEFKHGSYQSRLSVTFRNTSSTLKRADFRIVGSCGLLGSPETNGKFSGIAVKKRGSIEITRRFWSDLLKRPLQGVESVDWGGSHNRYFAVLFRPLGDGSRFFVEPVHGSHSPVLGVSEGLDIPAFGAVVREFDVYMGPMELAELERSGFQDVLDFGVFGWISRLILSVMFLIKSLTKSYGVSIILMTILINVLLYPLTFKSLLSMKRIQEVQPHVEALRERYKDDCAKMNRELMDLYKKHRINPLGGCVPMVFQMPIFIALYQSLSKSVELWGTPFLAIRDLSRPDGLIALPFSLPLVGSSVNILPILMSVAMFIQQRMMSTGSSAQSQQMMVMLPIFFLAICYQMPSGLIIYWITHTLITVSMQLFVTRRLKLPVSNS